MGLLSEFKEFISNGSVMDLTVGVITGAAFSKVVSSFTEDIVMPSVALLKSGIQQHVPGASTLNPETLANAVKTTPAVVADSSAAVAHVGGAVPTTAPATLSAGLATIGIGNFISALVYFLIISLVIMLVVKVANRFRKPAEVAVTNEQNLEPVLSREEALLIEIRDALLRTRE